MSCKAIPVAQPGPLIAKTQRPSTPELVEEEDDEEDDESINCSDDDYLSDTELDARIAKTETCDDDVPEYTYRPNVMVTPENNLSSVVHRSKNYTRGSTSMDESFSFKPTYRFIREKKLETLVEASPNTDALQQAGQGGNGDALGDDGVTMAVRI
jgi:hypothetical protein